MIEILMYVFLFSGVLFVSLAGVGLIRMPTLFMRLQATSKASTLGIIFMVIGMILYKPTLEVIIKGFLICFFLLLTAPIASHSIALAAKKHGCDR